MKVNFTEFPVYGNIEKNGVTLLNISKSIANGIYMNIPGIEAHILSEKIFKGDGELECSEEEVGIVSQVVALFPKTISDSWNDYVSKNMKN